MNKKILRTVITISKAFWLPIFGQLLLTGLQTFAGNYTFVAFQRLIDGFTGALRLADLANPLAWYIGANLVNHILIYLEGIPSALLSRGIVQWVKLRAIEKLASIDYLAYQNLGTGNLIQVVENAAESTHKIVTGFFMANLSGLVQIAVGLYFIHYYDQTLFYVILAGFGLFLLVANTIMRYLREALERMLNNQESFSKFSVRAFMELVVFRVNGRLKAEYERAKTISDEIVRARVQVYLLQELSYTGFALLIFLVEAGVVIEQASKILAGQSTAGTLVALVSFMRVIFWPVIGFGQSWMAYKMDALTFAHFDRFLSLPDDPGLLREGNLEIQTGQIVFDRVTYAYPGHEVLRDFSLTIPSGQTTALVGTSGSGKSTLVRLLLHLLKPQQGCISVDGQDLSAANLQDFYRQSAYIPQEAPIFDGSLRENLTFDHPVAEQRLEEVITQVGLANLVHSLPQGLDTVAGERGIKLSGGERQRLAFGRLLLQDPRIVILDEPTSAMDSVTEDLLTRGMAQFLRGRTVIVVAHRLQTVKDADNIVVLENGQIIQQGSFARLASIAGKFRELWEKQVQEGSAATDQ